MCEDLSRTTRVARKQHRCIWCGEPINPGDTYTDHRVYNDLAGTVDTQRWHQECETAFHEYAREERGGCVYFSAYEHARGSLKEG